MRFLEWKAKVALFALTAVLSFCAGWVVRGWKEASEIIEVEVAKDEKVRENQRNVEASGTKYEQRRQEREVVYKTIHKRVEVVVERPVYRNICIDNDGLQSLNKAINPAYRPASAASEPGSPMSEVRLPRRD